jgi:hypothetical protein
MLPSAVYDLTAFVNFKISNNFKQTLMKQIKNNQIQYPLENPSQPMDFKNLKKKIREPKVSRLLPNLCVISKKNS